MKLLKSCITASLVLAAFSAHAAPVVLNTGLVSMGLTDYGRLGALGVGFSGPTGDAILPGCLCEGWGAAANGSTGYTYGDSGDAGIVSGLTTATVTSGAGLSANNTTLLSNGLQVAHQYASAAGGKLFKVSISMTNTTGATLNDVRYARTLDWDVTPGFYDLNYTTVYGGTPAGPGGKVLHTSTNPFARPDPMVLRSQEANTNVTDSAGDKGSYFVFTFGNLAAGDSVSFDTYIGADSSVSGLLTALASVGVEAYSYTTGNERATDGHPFAPAYGYGFVGLDLPPINLPEPSSFALLGLGLAGLLAARRRT